QGAGGIGGAGGVNPEFNLVRQILERRAQGGCKVGERIRSRKSEDGQVCREVIQTRTEGQIGRTCGCSQPIKIKLSQRYWDIRVRGVGEGVIRRCSRGRGAGAECTTGSRWN